MSMVVFMIRVPVFEGIAHNILVAADSKWAKPPTSAQVLTVRSGQGSSCAAVLNHASPKPAEL